MRILSSGSKKGFSIIEILIVIAIIGITLASILGAGTFSVKLSTGLKETAQLNAVAQETMEAVRGFRDGTIWTTNGIGTLTVDAAYHPEKTAGVNPSWILVSGEGITGDFNQKVVFSRVSRDSNDNIVSAGGSDDSGTRKVTVTVYKGSKETEITTYLTDWKQ